MGASAETERRISLVNERLAEYMLPRDMWTPADEAVYQPIDLLRVPIEDAQALQFKAVKYVFTRHYTLNDFYHRYCEKRGVRPDDLKTNADLLKIPLIPDVTFKQHPSGVNFVHWVANLYTGELPEVAIGPQPTFDDVVDAFNAAGLFVAYSTGTTGQHTVIPRDKRTFYTYQYATAKMAATIYDSLGIDHNLALFPKPSQANLWVSQAQSFTERSYNDYRYALDIKITAGEAARAMSGQAQPENAQQAAAAMIGKVFETGIEWLDRYDKSTDTIMLSAPPALLFAFMDTLERVGKRYEFGERGTIVTGGGWKTGENKRIPSEHFRKRVEDILGIPETCCLDMYGMVEMNATVMTCPEGHYYHVPYTWLKPLVLDDTLLPVGYGEWGRFAFLDAIAHSYPGFVMTGDRVRLLEHCPICDRPGPVLDQPIERSSSEEMRGCAEEVRRVFAAGLKKALK